MVMIKVAIYIRVSTLEQAVEGYSVQAQKDRLIAFCTAKGFIIYDIYIDGGFSGGNLDRPAVQRLIEDAKAKKFDCVLVYKLDRLSRSQKDTLFLIEDVFLKHDVNFISMNESFDTSTPFGRAMIGILSVFAQLEREQIKERTRMGMAERAKEGLYHGGSIIPIGYDYIDSRLVINEYEAMQVKEIFQMYVDGYGMKKICETLHEKGYTYKYGDWHRKSTIQRLLENKLYIGMINHGDTEYKGQHEPIISEELFNKAQEIRNHRLKTHKKVHESKALLQGFVFCKNCGARYYSKHGRPGKRWYICYSRSKSTLGLVKDPNCKNKNWDSVELEQLFEDEILKLSFDEKKLQSMTKKKKPPKKDDSDIIKKKIAELDKQIGKLMDLYQVGTIPAEEIGKRIEKLYNEKKALAISLEVKPVDDTEFQLSGVTDLLKNVKALWKHATLDEKRNLMRTLVNKVYVTDTNIEVKWSFVPEE